MKQEPVGGILKQRVPDHVHQKRVNRVVVSEELLGVRSDPRLVHGLDERSQSTEIFVGCPSRRNVGDTALNGFPRLEHV